MPTLQSGALLLLIPWKWRTDPETRSFTVCRYQRFSGLREIGSACSDMDRYPAKIVAHHLQRRDFGRCHTRPFPRTRNWE